MQPFAGIFQLGQSGDNHSAPAGACSPTALALVDSLEDFCGRSPSIIKGPGVVLAVVGDGVEPGICQIGPYCLVADARVYDRRAATQAIGLEAGAACSSAELLLWALQSTSADRLLSQIDGDFAGALVDRRRQQLMLFTDPQGYRPLCYVCRPGYVAFASTPAALLALPEVERRLDLAAIAEFVLLLKTSANQTLYSQIHRVPAGHTLVCQRSGVMHLRRYHSFDDLQLQSLADEQDYVNGALGGLQRATQRRIDAIGGRIGIMLSGGLDSAAVAAAAAKHLASRDQGLLGYTSAPASLTLAGRRVGDEFPTARRIAEHLGNVHTTRVEAGKRTLCDDLERYFERCMYPPATPFNRLWLEEIHRLAMRDGLSALLSGTQGNLTISWDGWEIIADAVKGRRWGLVARALASQLRTQPRASKALLRGILRDRLLPQHLVDALRQLRRRLHGGSVSAVGRGLTPLNPALETRLHFAERFEASREAGRRELGMWRAIRFGAMGGGVTPDVNAMDWALAFHHDLECPDPTAELSLTRFCLSMPAEQHCDGLTNRRLAKRMLARSYPAELVERLSQRGLQSADWPWTIERSIDEAQGTLTALRRCSLATELLDLPRMQRFVDQWPGARHVRFEQTADYRAVLARGLVMGRFVLWVESPRGTPRRDALPPALACAQQRGASSVVGVAGLPLVVGHAGDRSGSSL